MISITMTNVFHINWRVIMLPNLMNLITQGGLKGINVTIRPHGADDLFVMLSPELTSFNDEAAHVKGDSDAYFAIRSALAQGVHFVGDINAIDTQFQSFVATAVESYKKATDSMTATAVAAKLDAASQTANDATKKAEEAKKAPAKKADSKAPKTAKKEETPQEPEKAPAQDSFSAFDDIDSI